jgi:acetylornithine/N-succinyldiaminopimelate aminotransferase
MHGTTFGGGPLICATALEFLTVVEEANLLANIRERSAELRRGLEKLATRFDFIREVRGEGLILGIDLTIAGSPIVSQALSNGLVINCTHEHILRLLPPFVIRGKDVVEFLAKFEKTLKQTSKLGAATKPKTETPAQPIVLAATR